MKNIRIFFTLIVVGFILTSCKKGDPQPATPANLLYNGDMETYPWNDWGFNYGYSLSSNPNNYTHDYTIEAASSPTHSIKLKCDAVKNDTTYCYFVQSLLAAKISAGAKLTLKAKIKTVNLQGTGLSLAIRGNKTGQTANTFFVTTQDKTPITGTSDFTEYTITSDALPATTDYVSIFLLYLPKTTGTAYFDDVTLIAN